MRSFTNVLICFNNRNKRENVRTKYRRFTIWMYQVLEKKGPLLKNLVNKASIRPIINTDAYDVRLTHIVCTYYKV